VPLTDSIHALNAIARIPSPRTVEPDEAFTQQTTFERVYVAGPMSGIPDYNFPAFRDAAENLRAWGYEVLSPVEMDEEEGLDPAGFKDGELSKAKYADVLSRDIQQIVEKGVEAIVVLPGFERSGGARTEVAFAQALGLPVVAYPTLEPVATATKDSGEVRIKNDATGGEKGRKPQRMELLPWDALLEVSELYAAGAAKYEDNNWRRGYAWSLSFGAAQRHLSQFWNGEDTDEETRCHHLTSAVFHCLALVVFKNEFPELDDRPRTALAQAARANAALGDE
jgi:hypothetical protein